MLVTMTARLVRSHGHDEVALPGAGRIEYKPAAHGVWEGALRGTDTVTARVVAGVAEEVELTPGPWRVRVVPDHGTAWDTFLVELTEGMPEPVDLVDLAPVLVVDGEKWTVGPAGASVTGAVDNGDQTVSFTLSDGTMTDPVEIPAGPQGERGPAGADGVDGAPGAPGVDGQDGAPGLPGTDGADGAPGIQGDPGPEGPEGPEGPQGERGTQGSPGAKGDPGNLGTTLIYGAGRPDVTSSMTPETAASVAAAVSGAEFISTDGPQGAWKWQKQGAVWAATVGDTGWRSLTLVGSHHSLTRVDLRRTGLDIHCRAMVVPNGTTSAELAAAPAGLRPSPIAGAPDEAISASTAILHGATGDDVGRLGTSRASIAYRGLTTVAQRHVARMQWDTADPWPTTLPGDAA